MPAILRRVDDAPQRAVVYLRQSTYKEESISLELQETSCRDYCERMGYTVVAVKEDPGITGRTWKRRGVVETMSMIEAHEADVIVLWKWSRLSRNRKDWALAIDKTDVVGGRIEAATEPIDVATASGRFARGVMTEFSVYQSELIGEVWEDVRQRRLAHGLPASGRLPFGWRWVKKVGIEPDPDQALIVVEMYRRYLAGDGSAAIARWLNEQGIPAPGGGEWSRPRPLTVMDSPIHAGLIPYRGKTYPGAHEPIIDRATFDTYLDERDKRRERNAKPRDYAHLLSQLVRCECGSRMHGKGSVTGGHWYGGYICPATLNGHEQRAYVSAKRLDPIIEQWFLTFDVEAASGSPKPLDEARRALIVRELAAAEDELATLTRQHLRGVVQEAAYVRTAALIDAEIATKNADLRALDSRRRARPDAARLYQMREDWEWWDVAAKNRALRSVIGRVEMLEAGTKARITATWGDSSVVDV